MANNNSQISATEFKKYFLNLVDEVKNKNSSFIITKRKIPVAKIVPIESPKVENEKSFFGSLKCMAKIKGDIVNFSTESEWDVNND